MLKRIKYKYLLYKNSEKSIESGIWWFSAFYIAIGLIFIIFGYNILNYWAQIICFIFGILGFFAYFANK